MLNIDCCAYKSDCSKCVNAVELTLEPVVLSKQMQTLFYLIYILVPTITPADVDSQNGK